jgi:peptidyl-prolyl cis-trans isomerase SurA
MNLINPIMKVKSIAFLCAFFVCVASSAQDKNAAVLVVDGEPTSLEEFENIFRKNNRDSVITAQSLNEYMELFINFKLKVKEAREAGLDTVKKFKTELDGYRAQLARPYLTDADKLNDLVKEAYENYKQEVHAAHILIKVDPNASPADTAKAYAKIMAIRERITKGEEFTALAKATSEDPSAKENAGDLGYFTAFQMVYPFEKAAYQTKVSEVSMPIRTRYGYHLIYVYDKRPARGEMHVAHIVVKPKSEENSEANADAKIQEIYQKLLSGESTFEELAAKYSDDPTSAKKGGELPWFGTGKMVLEFEDAAFELKNNGEYSKPFKTAFGWHIVKRLEYRPLASFESMEKDIKNKVSKDSRAEQTKKSFIEKLKKEYAYGVHEGELNKLIEKADSNAFEGKLYVNKKSLENPLIKMNGLTITVNDFNEYMRTKGRSKPVMTPGDYIRLSANKLGEDKLLQLEDAKLEEKYTPFRLLMKEYREGILLFEMTDQMVWSKAVKDTAGLSAYYEVHKGNFMWPERASAVIYTCSNADIAKKVRKMTKDGKDKSAIAGELNKESQLNLQVQEGIYAREDNAILANANWQLGLSNDIADNDQIVIIHFKEIIPPSIKKLDEARGMITSEYQTYLEQEWIAAMRKEHKYTVNQEVLHSIK